MCCCVHYRYVSQSACLWYAHTRTGATWQYIITHMSMHFQMLFLLSNIVHGCVCGSSTQCVIFQFSCFEPFDIYFSELFSHFVNNWMRHSSEIMLENTQHLVGFSFFIFSILFIIACEKFELFWLRFVMEMPRTSYFISVPKSPALLTDSNWSLMIS